MTATATAPMNGAAHAAPTTASPAQEYPLAAKAITGLPSRRHAEMPAELADRLRLAETLYKSQLCPEGYKSVEAVFVALQLGAELGLPPMSAVQSIAVVKGRPTLMYTAALALCRASGLVDYYDEKPEADACTVIARRRGEGNALSHRWTDADTQRAGIGGSTLHKNYPADGRRNRAGIRVLRSLFPDVLLGVAIPEEADEAEARGVSAWTVPASEFSELKRLIATSGMTVDALGDLVRAATGAELARDAAGKVNFDSLMLTSRAAWSQILEGVRAHARSRPAAKGATRPTITEPEPKAKPAPTPFARVQELAGQYGFRGDAAALAALVKRATGGKAPEAIVEADLQAIEADLASACEIPQ